MTTPALLCRIGWMQQYAGQLPGDERPIGGGSHNEQNLGREVFNFLPVGDRLRAYSQPPGRGFNLRRIDPQVEGDQIDGARVIFVARHPEGGSVVVGWYNNATIHRYSQADDDPARGGFAYFHETDPASAVLLPVDSRNMRVPYNQKGGMGRMPARYPYTATGAPNLPPWLEDILGQIDTYDGPNLLDAAEESSASKQVSEAIVEPAVAAVPSKKRSSKKSSAKKATDKKSSSKKAGAKKSSAKKAPAKKASGKKASKDKFKGGRPITAVARDALLARAMKKVRKHYKGKGWKLEECSANKNYDYIATKGKKKLYIVVKGIQGERRELLLTPGEVRSARKHYPNTVLALVVGIRLEADGKKVRSSRGKLKLWSKWKPKKGEKQAVGFRYLPGE